MFKSLIIVALSVMPLFCAMADQKVGSGGVKDSKSGIEAEVLRLFPNEGSFGSRVVRVRVTNHSAVERKVTCRLKSDYRASIPQVIGMATVPPGVSKTVDLFYPNRRNSYASFSVVVLPEGFDEIDIHPSMGFIGYADKCNIFISKGVPRDALQKSLDELKQSKACPVLSRSGMEIIFHRENDFPDPWRTDWRAYVPFNIWMISEPDFAVLSSAVRTALLDYTAAGGNLCIYGVSAFPADLAADSRAGAERREDDIALSMDFGRGRLFTMDSGPAPAFSTGICTYALASLPYLGFDGTRDVEDLEKATGLDTSLLNASAPIGLFSSLLIAFFVLAGPVTLIVLARMNKRLHVVWVIPLLGILFGGVVLLSIIISEGTSPTVIRSAMTTIYQREKRAVTEGLVYVYSPFELRSGLAFDAGDEVGMPEYDSDDEGGQIVCGNKLFYSPDMIRPRLFKAFTVRKSGHENRRVEVSREKDGRVKVVNALGVEIREITVSDGETRFFAGTGIKPGEEVVLEKASPSGAVLGLLGGKKKGAAFYRATLDSCPFFENPVLEETVKSSESAVVIGYFDFQNGKGASK